MRWFCFLIVLLLPVASFCTHRVSAQQNPPAAGPASPAAPLPPKQDPEAAKTLDKAIDLYDPRKLAWLETELWQQVNAQGITFQTQGRYLCGPDYRRRLDLKVQLGEMDGELQIVSDGATIWQCLRLGSGTKMITKTELKKVLDTVNSPGTLPQVSEQLRHEFLQSQSLAGVAPLLKNLREQMTFTKQSPTQWHGHEVFELIGVWSSDMAKAIAPLDRWPAALPRTCRLYLDKQTLWPYRLEWWGPSPPKTEDSLLLQMEFRDPIIGKADAKPPAHFEGAFTFDAGSTPVIDQTKDISEGLKARAQQLAAQRSTPSRDPGSSPGR